MNKVIRLPSRASVLLHDGGLVAGIELPAGGAGAGILRDDGARRRTGGRPRDRSGGRGRWGRGRCGGGDRMGHQSVNGCGDTERKSKRDTRRENEKKTEAAQRHGLQRILGLALGGDDGVRQGAQREEPGVRVNGQWVLTLEGNLPEEEGVPNSGEGHGRDPRGQ